MLVLKGGISYNNHIFHNEWYHTKKVLEIMVLNKARYMSCWRYGFIFIYGWARFEPMGEDVMYVASLFNWLRSSSDIKRDHGMSANIISHGYGSNWFADCTASQQLLLCVVVQLHAVLIISNLIQPKKKRNWSTSCFGSWVHEIYTFKENSYETDQVSQFHWTRLWA